MEFRIDTSMVGEVKVPELKGVLEASWAHFKATQKDYAGRQILATAQDQKEHGYDAMATMALGEKAKAAMSAHDAKLAALDSLAESLIAQACEQAELCDAGALVTARIVGHVNARHASGCAKRFSVQVDQTWKE